MKKSELRNIIREEISKLKNEGIFGTSDEKEERKLEDALDRFVKYSMEKKGFTSKSTLKSTIEIEEELLKTLEKKGRRAVDIYIGSKIDDDKLLNMYDDVMSNVPDSVIQRGKEEVEKSKREK